MLHGDITDTSTGYEKRISQWRKVRDVLEGEERIKERSTVYLPKPRGQKAPDYRAFKERASFYAVTDRTLRGLTGLVFRTDPVLNLPSRLKPLRDALTAEGFSAEEAIREGTREILSLGRYGILVDMPTQAGISNIPMLATYKAEDIIDWSERTINSVRKVTRVVVREEETTAHEVTRTIIRELMLINGIYVQNVYEEMEAETRGSATTRGAPKNLDSVSGQFKLIDTFVPNKNGAFFDAIPFWFVNTYDMRPRTEKPPMLDLANTNLAHWRNSADYEQSLFMTSQPTPFLFGVPAADVPKSIGSATIWHSEAKDVKAGFVEFQGKGIGALSTAMDKKEERMAAQGARLINEVDTTNKTADTTRLQTRAETSILTAGVSTLETAFVQALKFAADWAGASPDDVSLTMNRDYIETSLTAPELLALVQGWQSGAYSKQTLHENLQSGEIIPTDRTLEEEDQLIGDEGPLPGFSQTTDDIDPDGTPTN